MTTIKKKAGGGEARPATKQTTSQSHLIPLSSSAQVDRLLSRLDAIKQTGSGRWIACCPSHSDRSPSLGIRELPDGKILLRCFAGCAVENVLAAVSLTFSDLFSERLSQHRTQPLRRPFYASDILEAIAFEALVVSVAASAISKKLDLPPPDYERLMLASARLQHAAEVAHGR